MTHAQDNLTDGDRAIFTRTRTMRASHSITLAQASLAVLTELFIVALIADHVLHLTSVIAQ